MKLNEFFNKLEEAAIPEAMVKQIAQRVYASYVSSGGNEEDEMREAVVDVVRSKYNKALKDADYLNLVKKMAKITDSVYGKLMADEDEHSTEVWYSVFGIVADNYDEKLKTSNYLRMAKNELDLDAGGEW